MTAAALARDPDDGRFVDYLTPDGEFLAIWIAAGVQPLPRPLYEYGRGKTMQIELAPISKAEVEWLLAYACRPQAYSPALRYQAYAALGAGDSRVGFVPLAPAERRAAIRQCADSAQMLRLMGVQIGGAL